MILLTFNIINPDQVFKNTGNISDVEILKITEQNTNAILRSLECAEILATFLIGISLIPRLQRLVKRIIIEGHELSFCHLNSTLEELEFAKKETANLIGKQIRGLRVKKDYFFYPY